MNENEERTIRFKAKCACGAVLLCRPRAVGQTKKCPACSADFLVPHPEPPPEGALWNIPFQKSAEFYKYYEDAITEYSKAINARENHPDLFEHILRTLDIIRCFKDQYSDYRDDGVLERYHSTDQETDVQID